MTSLLAKMTLQVPVIRSKVKVKVCEKICPLGAGIPRFVVALLQTYRLMTSIAMMTSKVPDIRSKVKVKVCKKKNPFCEGMTRYVFSY